MTPMCIGLMLSNVMIFFMKCLGTYILIIILCQFASAHFYKLRGEISIGKTLQSPRQHMEKCDTGLGRWAHLGQATSFPLAFLLISRLEIQTSSTLNISIIVDHDNFLEPTLILILRYNVHRIDCFLREI